MKTLELSDFTLCMLESGQTYFSYKEDDFELCIETCLNGNDIAVYHNKSQFATEKVCTNLNFTVITNYNKLTETTLKLVNEMYAKYKKTRD